MAVSVVNRPSFLNMPEDTPVPKPIMNWNEIAKSVTGILTAELQGLLADVDADLRLVAQEIAPVIVSAVAAGDTALKAELLAQLEAIAEIHKIRGNARAWAVVSKVSSVVLQVLSVGVAAAVGRIG